MVKELLEQKDEIAKLAYAWRVEINPHDIERGAQLFGNVPGLARYMPPGLQAFSIEFIPLYFRRNGGDTAAGRDNAQGGRY